MKENTFIVAKMAKQDLAKCYDTPYRTFARRIKTIADDSENWLKVHKNHSFTFREVEFIVEELGIPKYSLEDLKKKSSSK